MDSKTTNGPENGQRPVHTVRRGAIAANIWLRQTQTGKDYYDYSLSRSWKNQSKEKEGYSTNFFSGNATELVAVVNEATNWIAERSQPAAVAAPVNAIGRIQPVKVPASEAR